VFLASGSASFNNENVGTGKPVSVSGISISGADSGNYNQLNTTASTTADITPKPVVGNFTAADKVWDGTTAATVLTRSLAIPIAGDDVSLVGGSATFNNANVGTGKTVTLTGSALSGADAGNYSLSAVNTAVASITAWNATGKGFYAPVGVANSIFVPASPTATLPSPNTATIWNTVKGGQTVPLKFNVFAGTVEKTALTDIAAFTEASVPCTSGDGEDPVDITTTGNTSLRYDTTAMQWIQNWKTQSYSSSKPCWRASVKFADGSTLSAFFLLKK
jgi:hypothetical protein